ncbi:MAG: cytochrome c3 family protein [Bryobacteraceae bacterium]
MFARTAVWIAALAISAAQETPQPRPKFVPSPPVQPIAFSHRVHTAAGLECKGCHPVPEPGDFATIPETSKCMSCHRTVKSTSPAIERLAEFHTGGKPVPWRRVYRVPDYVYFSHKEHVAKGVTCDACHGPVRERDALSKEKETSMAACMDCHRARQASLACNYCHEQK